LAISARGKKSDFSVQGQFHSVPRPVVNKEMPFELIAVPEGAAFISCNLSVFFLISFIFFCLVLCIFLHFFASLLQFIVTVFEFLKKAGIEISYNVSF